MPINWHNVVNEIHARLKELAKNNRVSVMTLNDTVKNIAGAEKSTIDKYIRLLREERLIIAKPDNKIEILEKKGE